MPLRRVGKYGVDLLPMPRHAPEFTVPKDGSCSFCGKTRRETRAFVGSSIMDVRICDGCLGLCCSVLAEMAGLLEGAPECAGADFPEHVLAEIMAALATKPPRATPPPNPEFRCSFCDARRPDDVPVLVSGPRVFNCNACVSDGVTVVKRAVNAPT
jgi:hypothetical protein